ncbi:endonuclease/exonuclease/phosphatase family protein [Hymenobacter nivis]|uniref:Endonuclease n=1 Tax=Hymenobacter nivis TaxID=1850093 RepID=A0A2Z3GM39_9BACT|nr:endonuclease/exonuclease/phosphatase family protein [Hymenobacter nivis]AWM34298.1 endonuclease [Hymenobacter nivis]
MFKKVFLAALLLSTLAGPLAAQTLKLATYNIRYDNKQDTANAWLRRLPYMAGLIKFQDFDLFGTQEVLHNQLLDLAGALPGYGHVGVGRDDGKEAGEYAAIFYKKAKFELLKQGTFWLSPTPAVPSKGWDAALPRICTWGQFRDRSTGFVFYFFNTHFDHVGVVARRESAKLILAQVQALAGTAPAVLSGDFNVDQRNESYALVNASGRLKDAYTTAALVYAPSGTFNNFDPKTKSDARIDHIFLSPAFTVARYGILTDTYGGGKMPSDHYPVAVDVRYARPK